MDGIAGATSDASRRDLAASRVAAIRLASIGVLVMVTPSFCAMDDVRALKRFDFLAGIAAQLHQNIMRILPNTSAAFSDDAGRARATDPEYRGP